MSITQKAGFGYQHQLLPGMHPGGAPMPNFFMPMAQQGQQGPRPGGRRPVQQTQQSVPLMQHQMMLRGRMYRYPPAGRNVGDMPVPGGGQMFPVPYDMGGGMLPRDSAAAIPQPPIPVTALASALVISTPEQQRTGLWKASLFGAYDKASIKFQGVEADINFTLEDYEDLKRMSNLTKEEFVHVLRRQSTGLPRGSSKYRGMFIWVFSIPKSKLPRHMIKLPSNVMERKLLPIWIPAFMKMNSKPLMLGENLYPLVDQLEHEHAAKVTGMLLEMDQTEVLHLLESPDALKNKVNEAMDVLKNVQQANLWHCHQIVMNIAYLKTGMLLLMPHRALLQKGRRELFYQMITWIYKKLSRLLYYQKMKIMPLPIIGSDGDMVLADLKIKKVGPAKKNTTIKVTKTCSMVALLIQLR